MIDQPEILIIFTLTSHLWSFCAIYLPLTATCNPVLSQTIFLSRTRIFALFFIQFCCARSHFAFVVLLPEFLVVFTVVVLVNIASAMAFVLFFVFKYSALFGRRLLYHEIRFFS
jgi:hypothetical protein